MGGIHVGYYPLIVFPHYLQLHERKELFPFEHRLFNCFPALITAVQEESCSQSVSSRSLLTSQMSFGSWFKSSRA